MRVLVILLCVLLINLPAVAWAQSGGDRGELSYLRQEVRGFLLEVRDFGLKGFAAVKTATRFSDDQLYGIGVGVAGGLVISNTLGFGWVLTAAVVVSSGWIGKWIFDE